LFDRTVKVPIGNLCAYIHGRQRERVLIREVFRRARAVFYFAILLAVCVAAPGVAETAPVEPQEILPPGSQEVNPERLPGAADVTAMIQKAEADEAAHAQRVASPEALAQREVSQTAYSGLSAPEAERLLGETFSGQLGHLNADPARFLSDAGLVSASEDPTAGTVRSEGESTVLDAAIPLQTEDEQGGLSKVDLTLEATAQGFETTNALVDVDIPSSASASIEVGEEEIIYISQEAVAGQEARRFGDENVFYPDVLPDTDMLVSPIAGGVEIFNQLRSSESPETFRFEIEVPDGGFLRESEGGGADVVSGEETIATIPPATAVDAQGTAVPVALTVEGDSIVLQVTHRNGEYAMPILLDPILENNENWIYGQNHNALDMGVWGFNKNVAGMYGNSWCIYHCFGQPNNVRGLFISGQSGTYYGGQFAQWSYSAPNMASYVMAPTLAPYVRYDHDNCNAATTQYKQPHDYFGIWGHNNQWVYHSVNSANQPGNTYSLPYGGLAVIFGLGTGAANFSIPCWRNLYAGGAHVFLDDWNPPWLEWINGRPSGWFSDETPFTVTAMAKDEGLGIKNVRIHVENGPILPDIAAHEECAGTRRSPCFTSHTATWDNIHGGWFPFEGERTAWIGATDASGKSVAGHHWTMKIDNSVPKITVGGEFAEEIGEVGEKEVPAGKGDQLSLPVYNLRVQAKDGKLDHPFNKSSGVEDIQIWLDGVEQQVPWNPQPCPQSSCEMEVTYPVPLTKLDTSGKHVLKVEAVDYVGKRIKRELEFEYFPATGMKPEYVTHYFPLPDGQGNEAEEENPRRPELAVNVMNGNLIYRQTDIDVGGAAGLDLEVERYYNSMLPENEETEWGDGWTLAQTPVLDPMAVDGSPVPNQADVLDSSGAIEDAVGLPTQAGASQFDPELQVTLTKKAGGGYEMTDETGQSAASIAFDAGGQTEALLDEGFAKVDYEYEGGELSEIEVSDPSTFSADPAELAIPEPQLITAPTFAASFGSAGTTDGRLSSPADVAVDAHGNLWVVDRANNRVQKFDPTGKFLSKFGSPGIGNGQFNRPTAIAIASNGDLLVADAGNSRVQRFSAAGAFISKFGTKGTGSGQFSGAGPEGLAVDPVGNIWVSDTYGGKIQKFSPAGAYLQSVGTKGTAPGQLGKPTGIDVDPSGHVWVADWENHRVSVFRADGTYVDSFGSLGTGDGQLKNPDAIEVDNLDNIWVGEQSNNRIHQFELNGQNEVVFKARFGAPGSGPGQFNFSSPMDLAVDSKGNLWVADVSNHRVQHWRVPVERPAYVSVFGGAGSTDGKLLSPSDVAIGVEGNLWVVDKGNNRIVRFDKNGSYLGKFGAYGTNDGQFNRPTAIAVDRDGNLLVTDANNARVQKFSPEGQFISKFGAPGTGDGQLASPEGIATDLLGNIWVADSGNGRIQGFDQEGAFLEVIGSKGSGPGQLGRPVSLDVDDEGRIWVADWDNHRVSVFDGDGTFVGDFGSQGSGTGQFQRPSAIEIDAHDNVWVADQGNGRIQRFDLEAEYHGQFGTSGSGEGQFSFTTSHYPLGLASDETGRIWVPDSGSARIQQWMLGNYAPEDPEPLSLNDGDPKVEVETQGDLVTSVSGSAAGTHTYEHEGDFLTSHSGPQGETVYKKNSAGLLSKVSLPNGTWAEITYRTDKRVVSVTVAPYGTGAKTTYFYYEDGPPRRSIVAPPPPDLQITYDIARNGSVLKRWHKGAKPEIVLMTGNLWAEREKQVAATNLTLAVEGDSPHGIDSIQIIANGNQLVSEKKCAQDRSTPEIECERVEDVWATDTGSLAPGILHLEVIVTASNGLSESRRWWVNIPQTPPPTPGYPQPPRYSEIERFRETYGLEVVFPVVNERQLAERIYGLINAWHDPSSQAGQVARASAERWGVPLRPEDLAELEYRERYLAHNGPMIAQWGESQRASTYAGYYMDHRAGGRIRVGFTSAQEESLAALANPANNLVATDRLAVFPATPSSSLIQLRSISQDFDQRMVSRPDLIALLTTGRLDILGNRVAVGATDVGPVSAFLNANYGVGGDVVVYFDPTKPVQRKTWLEEGVRAREMNDRLYAGDWYRAEPNDGGCTLAFGAWERRGLQSNGASVFANYALSAGHCYGVGVRLKRAGFKVKEGKKVEDEVAFGVSERNSFGQVQAVQAGFETDALAIRLDKGTEMPRWIYWSPGYQSMVNGAADWRPGQTLCLSGTWGGTHCGPTEAEPIKTYYEGSAASNWQIRLNAYSEPGDSGSPIWDPITGSAVGILSGGPKAYGAPTDIAPLLSLEGRPYTREVLPGTAPGALGAPGMSSPGRLTVVDAVP
jgi:streptogramin lyase